MTLTGEHIRTARQLLGWSQIALAVRAGVGINQLKNFESGKRAPGVNNLAAIRAALERAGVEFIAENGGGAGGSGRESVDNVLIWNVINRHEHESNIRPTGCNSRNVA